MAAPPPAAPAPIVIAQAPKAAATPAPAAAAPPAPQPQPQPQPQPSPTPTPAPAVANDARYFAQTGYRVAEDAFWTYFLSRGGVRSFGYPVSNEFVLYGKAVMEVVDQERKPVFLLIDEGQIFSAPRKRNAA